MIEVDGLDELQEEIKDILDSLDDIQSFYKLLETELNEEVNQSIIRQTSNTTNRGFNALTAASQQLLGKPARPTLRRTTVKLVITNRGKDGYMVTDLPYDYIHQFGNPNNTLFGYRAPIPARPFMPIRKDGTFTARFENKIDEILQTWIDSKLTNE